uniref:Heterogeneous nuclear ribonucleoprotein K (Trinotate prediction) n=1 Tax=Myxobolus squamalis TaxID=59785 RepID=A0A6B2FYZ5_MYXSQ
MIFLAYFFLLLRQRYSRSPASSTFNSPYPTPSNRLDGPSRTTQVSIPSKYVGPILGPSGANIKRIRLMSGCRVELEDPIANCSLRIIVLTGSDKQINDAEFYMQEIIREEDRNRRIKN